MPPRQGAYAPKECNVKPTDSSFEQRTMNMTVGILSVLFTGMLVFAIDARNPIMVVAQVYLLSAIPSMAVTVWLERPRSLKQHFDLRVASWSKVIGDSVFIPIALAACSVGWRSLPPNGWHESIWWKLGAWTVGLVYLMGFMWVDRKNYAKEDAIEALSSPGKWVHDGMSVLGLSTGLVFGFFPLALYGLWERPLMLMIAGFVGWLVLAVVDFRFRPSYCRQRHPKWNKREFCAVPW
ncbi:hypothetical protein TM7_0093 [candidate division TM7 genomosp. GTL1]|nr:hypothetical protein TM7_0093 [candidate division TM7 genomosp. GTL1]